MKILIQQPPSYHFGFAYSADLGCNAPSSEIYVENPVTKAITSPFESTEAFSKKLTRELKAIKKQQAVAFGIDYEIFADEICADIFETALKCCMRLGFHAAIVTSCSEIIKHLPTLKQLAPYYCSVAIKIPSADDSVLQIMQPGFPLFQQRLQIIKQLAESKIKTGVWITPVLPFINDSELSLSTILESAAQNGATFAAYQKKLALNDTTRQYLFDNIGLRYPQLVEQYQQLFSGKDETFGPNFMALSNTFVRTAKRCGMTTGWPEYRPPQLSLF